MSTIVTTLPAGSIDDAKAAQDGWLARFQTYVHSSDVAASTLAVFDQAMISGTNFVTAVIIGRCCGAETLGLFSLIAAAMAMIVGVHDQLVTAPYVLYHNRKQPAELLRYNGSILSHHVIFVILVMAGMCCCSFAVRHADDTVRVVTAILLIAAPAILLRTFIRELSLAQCNVLTVFAVDAAVCISRLIAIVMLFATDTVNLPTIYFVLGVSSLLTAVIWMARNRQQFVFHKQTSISDWRHNWKFGRWALATHVAGTSTPYTMPWVLFLMHGERATGYLASCSVIVGIANILLSGMSDFLSPRAASAFVEGGIAQLRRVLVKMLRLSILSIGTVCIIAAFFGEPIIAALYDGRFPGAGRMVFLLTLSVLANAIGMAAGTGLWALDKPRANFTADMLTLVIAIAAAPILVAPYGAIGAAMATLVASVSGAIFRQTTFHQVVTQQT
jgi:O-antigen/teichoic acid export membrane protein